MFSWKPFLALLLTAALAGCGAADDSVRPDDSSAGVYEFEADASPEHLYFELVRLHSLDEWCLQSRRIRPGDTHRTGYHLRPSDHAAHEL
jgi:hypothetical protein